MYRLHQSFQVSFEYPVIFTQGVFSKENKAFESILSEIGSKPHRILPVVDANVLAAHSELASDLDQYVDASKVMQLVSPIISVAGGEASKAAPSEIINLHDKICSFGIDRHSFILAIGGGAMLDAVGFAAATAHRGIRLIRLPTTVLAQNDAGIGVKNAINFRGRKNFLGCFSPPYAVINDYGFIQTLTERDKRAGIAEAIKVALIKDSEFFAELYDMRQELATFQEAAMRRMIIRCAELHLEHIRTSGDPFELGSARPLDFGHWSAHKLEEISNHRIRHGEAVAIGIAIDSIYSNRNGLIDYTSLERILDLLKVVGFDLDDEVLEQLDVHNALDEFRQHLGGNLYITLLQSIGKGVEVNEINIDRMRESVAYLKR